MECVVPKMCTKKTVVTWKRPTYELGKLYANNFRYTYVYANGMSLADWSEIHLSLSVHSL